MISIKYSLPWPPAKYDKPISRIGILGWNEQEGIR